MTTSDRETLRTLTRVSRSRPKESRLCCSLCRSECKLTGGELVCVNAECGARFATLAQLGVEEGGAQDG